MLSVTLVGYRCGVWVEYVDQQVAMLETNHVDKGAFEIVFVEERLTIGARKACDSSSVPLSYHHSRDVSGLCG